MRLNLWRMHLTAITLCVGVTTGSAIAEAQSQRCYGEWEDPYLATGTWSDQEAVWLEHPGAWYKTSEVKVYCGGRVGYVGISLSRDSVGEVDAWVCDDENRTNCGVVTNPTDDPDHYVACYAQIQTDDAYCRGTLLDDDEGGGVYGYETRHYSEGPDLRSTAMDENGQRLICRPSLIRAVCITNP